MLTKRVTMTVCLSHESYGTVIMTLYETIGGTEVVKQRIIVGCDLDSFETSTPYMNSVFTLSMANMDGNVAFSK